MENNGIVEAILVSADDWQGLYVNGHLIAEDHNLDNPFEWVRWAHFYGISVLDSVYLHKEDIEEVELNGSFPEELSGFKHKYGSSGQ